MDLPGWANSLVTRISGQDRDEPTTDELLAATIDSPWRNLRDRLEGYSNVYTTPAIQLIDDGCKGSSSGRNGSSGSNGQVGQDTLCSARCYDSDTMFASWQTTWNCLALATVWQTNRTFEEEDFGPSLTTFLAAHVYEEFGFDMTSFNGEAVLNNTYECALASCRSDGASCTFSLPNSLDDWMNGDSEWSSSLNSSFCHGVKAEANPDIAGPGIYMSLMLQNVIALYAWTFSLCLCLRIIIDCAASPLLSLHHRIRKTPHKPARFIISRPRLDRLFLCLERANVSHATRSFAADFSEAQCFFVTALAVAVIYADSQGASFNGATNWPSVRLNQRMSTSITFFATLPTILVQVALTLMGMDSIYSLVLCTVAVVLSGVAATLMARDPDVTRIRDMLTMDEGRVGLPQCGGNPSLRALCGGTSGGPDVLGRRFYRSILIWPWLVLLGFLWLYKFRRHLRHRGRLWFYHLQEGAEQSTLGRNMLLFLRKLIWLLERVFVPFILPLAQLFLISMMTGGIVNIADEINDARQIDSDRSWTLGQVVAVLVWVPVLAKYMYTLTFGVERGFNIRLSEPYSVHKDLER